MRILMEPSDYTFFNVGDMAMTEVALARLRALWPGAAIQVLTDDARALLAHYGAIVPLTTASRQAWLARERLRGTLSPYRSSPEEGLWRFRRQLRRHWPVLVGPLVRFGARTGTLDNVEASSFLTAMAESDLVVVSGMGGITDPWEEYAFDLLDTLELAIRSGKPTAMFGQGIGPILNPELRARAKAVLPAVDFIALREDRAGRPLLTSLGVDPGRIVTTGDDAIELAYQARVDCLGDGLGINLRVGWYSEVDEQLIELVRPVLQRVAGRHGAPMVPVPISRTPGEEDLVTIRELTRGYRNVLDGCAALDTPLRVIRQIHHCRAVVAGSYHAAVFALGQGIPVVGLANSAYYVDKFLGLAEQFGTGSEVVSLKDPDLLRKLEAAIERAWLAAEQVRPQLLEAAARQMELSKDAYRRVYEMLQLVSAGA